jgi:hypothetical protein
VRDLNFSVIPVSAQRKTGTHTRDLVRRDLCLWVPDKRSALSGMTQENGSAGVTR